ncbi:unnamed protein product, partial [Cylindrotheca closterium]
MLYSANYVRLTCDDDHDTHHDSDHHSTMMTLVDQSTGDASHPIISSRSLWPASSSPPPPLAIQAHHPCHNYQDHLAENETRRHCNFSDSSSWCEMSEWLFQPQVGRENHLYFGCCCDVRRAVVALNLLTICLLFALLVSYEVFVRIMHEPLGNLTREIFPEVGHGIRGNAEDESSDPDYTIQDSPSHGHWFLYMLQRYMDVWILVCIILHSVGVYGAIKFKLWAVQVAAIAYALPLVLSIVYLHPIVFVVSGGL